MIRWRSRRFILALIGIVPGIRWRSRCFILDALSFIQLSWSRILYRWSSLIWSSIGSFPSSPRFILDRWSATTFSAPSCPLSPHRILVAIGVPERSWAELVRILRAFWADHFYSKCMHPRKACWRSLERQFTYHKRMDRVAFPLEYSPRFINPQNKCITMLN